MGGTYWPARRLPNHNKWVAPIGPQSDAARRLPNQNKWVAPIGPATISLAVLDGWLTLAAAIVTILPGCPFFLFGVFFVVPKKALFALVLTLPLTVVGFAVLMGGAAWMRAMNDEAGGFVLTWIAAAFLMVGIADSLILLLALGMRALNEPDTSTEPSDTQDTQG